ncbi:uncharacterized protein LOC132187640 isoform X2 [Corylus avellana]|uniref:uncharacterized protein LOC132187640 isoform X2 n=1 Tax=Corylus avellana TaxID=13451 RepID=UPI00286CAF76|nr:uncharacterized protein LOC132187640 isoform X2 [Corylus avellana]
MESREQMPSVIARLMGLDELPPQQPVQKQQRVLSDYYLQRVASIGVREKRSSNERASFRMSIEEQKELSYIFRVLDKLNGYKHHNLSVEDGKLSSSSSEEKVAFIRHNFLDSKCISGDRKHQNQKELQDAMDITDSKKDLFPKYFQEPDSLFTKHSQYWKGVPPDPQSGHGTVSKSSCTSYSRNTDKRRNLGRTTVHGNVKLLQKPENGLVGNSYREFGLDNICEFSRSRLESNSEHPRKKIVILEPNHDKAENDARCFSSSSSYKGSFLSDRKLKDVPAPENRKLHIEVKERKNLAYDIEPTRQWPGVSSEISREVTNRTRHGTIRIPKKLSRSGLRVDGTFVKQSQMMVPSNFYYLKNQCKFFSFSHGSYVTREAKKQISEQGKMNYKFQKDGFAGQASTLGELLAMPDDENGTKNVNYKPNKYGLSNQTGPNDGHVNSGNHLGISKDDLKNGSVRNLPRSSSLPAFSSATGSTRIGTRYEGLQSDLYLSLEESVNRGQHRSRNQNLNQKYGLEYRNLFSYKKSYSFSCLDLESNHTVEEMCVVLDEVKNKFEKGLSNQDFVGPQSSSSSSSFSGQETNHIVQDTRVVEAKLKNKLENMSEQNALLPKPSVFCVASVSMATDVTDAESNVVGRPSGNAKEEQFEPAPCIIETNSDSSHASDTLIQQETSVGFCEEGSVFSQCSHTGQESISSLEEAYHPSPVSVLEPHFKEDSEFLESVSSDICETHSEGHEIIVSSDEDSGEGSVDDPEENKDLMRLFRVEEGRDFSYLIDVITEAGFHGRILEMNFGTWHSPECPISLSIFETLEKKCGEHASWKRSERRLLFDRINSGLIEMLQPYMGIPKWAKPASKIFNPRLSQDMIEEELWRLLVSQEQEMSKDPTMKVLEKELGSLDLGEDIDFIGREIERLLIDELAAEVVSMDTF